MPTATEYDGWADRLTDHQPTLGSLLAGPLTLATPDTLAGGTLGALVDIALRASHDNSYEAMTKLTSLIEECRDRAAVCRQYELDWQHYQRQVDAHDRAMDRYAVALDEARADGRRIGMPPTPPSPPRRPAEWVERG